MNLRSVASTALAAIVGGAAVFAVMHNREEPAPERSQTATAEPHADPRAGAGADPHAGMTLPSGHPAVGATSEVTPIAAPVDLAWTMPAAWKQAPSPSTMRLATYKVAAAKGDAEDAEVSVVRAGGSADANIDRWIGQFSGASAPVRDVKTVAGMKVTFVEVAGTYSAGSMMGGAASAPKTGWALHGAIVEQGEESTFFKMTGPAATVKNAHDAFVAMVTGIMKK